MKNSDISIQKAQQEIEEESRRLEESNGGGHDRRLAEFQARTTDVDNATKALEAHKEAAQPLQSEREQVALQIAKLKSRTVEREQAVQESKARLRELREEAPHRSGYPANMSRLLQSIGNDRGFQERPVGPMGNYVQLNAPVWSRVLEKAMGSTLNGFIVTSKQDQDRLSALMQDVKW